MNRSESIKELASALAKAQRQMRPAIKDSANPFFKSSYADLASVWDACREALTANGLAVIQTASAGEGSVTVETMLAHDSGEWVSEKLTLPAAKADAQGVGSAITYARRYGLASITGVCPEDDDGNGASGKRPPPQQQAKPAPKPPTNGHADPAELRKKALTILEEAAKGGLASLEAMWKTLSPAMQKTVEQDKGRLKKEAEKYTQPA